MGVIFTLNKVINLVALSQITSSLFIFKLTEIVCFNFPLLKLTLSFAAIDFLLKLDATCFLATFLAEIFFEIMVVFVKSFFTLQEENNTKNTTKYFTNLIVITTFFLIYLYIYFPL